MYSTRSEHIMERVSESVIKAALPKVDIGKLLDRAAEISDEAQVVQFFNREAVASREHVLGAYLNALIAFRNHTNRARSIGIEMLLFVSLTDQINDALKIAGAKPESEMIVFASSTDMFSKIAPMLKGISDFNQNRTHQSAVLEKLGIKNTGDAYSSIMQAMAMSRLGP